MAITFAPSLSMLFVDAELRERPQIAASFGFTAVETWWPFPDSSPSNDEVTSFIRAIERADVSLVQMNLFGGDPAVGDRGITSTPGREHEYAASLEVAEVIADQTGCRRFNSLWGHVGQTDAADRRAVAYRNLAAASHRLDSFDGTVLLEPLTVGENGDYPLTTAREVLDIVDDLTALGATNVALLADVYHLANNGDDPVAVLREHRDRIGHIQIADAPGRHEPGSGALPWEEIFTAVQSLWADPVVALEYRATASGWNSFGWIPR